MAALSPTVIIDPSDDVAVALRAMAAGVAVATGVAAVQPIPAGHKVAIRAVAAGAPVRKYGFPIGRARVDSAPGEHVHTHNLATDLSAREAYAFHPRTAASAASTTAQPIE